MASHSATQPSGWAAGGRIIRAMLSQERSKGGVALSLPARTPRSVPRHARLQFYGNRPAFAGALLRFAHEKVMLLTDTKAKRRCALMSRLNFRQA